VAFDAHKNFAYSTIATAPSPATSGTSLVVAAGEGSKFPAVPFNAVIWPTGAQPSTANAEVVRVTNISTDTLTITRAQESTVARTVIVGDQIAAAITAKTLQDLEVLFTPGGSAVITLPTVTDTLVGMSGYNRAPSLDVAIQAGFGVCVPEDYEIVSGFSLDIGDGGIFEIG
jgi:hypothetical protein